METSDVIKLKEGIKEALKNWTGSKIDALFPKKPQTRDTKAWTLQLP